MKTSVRSILDPSRVLTYCDDLPPASVLGLDAADHMLMVKDRSKGAVLRFLPELQASRPSFWRRALIQAVAHVLVHLVDPRAGSALVDEHLQKDARGVVRRFQCRKYCFHVDGRDVEFVDDGHSLNLHIDGGRVEHPLPRPTPFPDVSKGVAEAAARKGRASPS